jgi:hypothetical protein
MNNDIDNPNSEYWKQKYLKYKSKYMNLNNSTGGRHSHRSNSPYKNRSNSPYKNRSNNYYNNPYYRPQYPTLPQMPFIVTNSDSNLTIGNDNSDVSIVMPLSPLGPFGPVARGNTRLGPRGQFFTVLSPKSKKPTPTTTTTTTTTTSFTNDPIYKLYHNDTINSQSVIYFRISNGSNYLVTDSDSVIELNLLKDKPYSEQIQSKLTEILGTPPSLSEIQKPMYYMTHDKHLLFNMNTTSTFKTGFKFDASSLSLSDKSKISI